MSASNRKTPVNVEKGKQGFQETEKVKPAPPVLGHSAVGEAEEDAAMRAAYAERLRNADRFATAVVNQPAFARGANRAEIELEDATVKAADAQHKHLETLMAHDPTFAGVTKVEGYFAHPEKTGPWGERGVFHVAALEFAEGSRNALRTEDEMAVMSKAVTAGMDRTSREHLYNMNVNPTFTPRPSTSVERVSARQKSIKAVMARNTAESKVMDYDKARVFTRLQRHTDIKGVAFSPAMDGTQVHLDSITVDNRIYSMGTPEFDERKDAALEAIELGIGGTTRGVMRRRREFLGRVYADTSIMDRFDIGVGKDGGVFVEHKPQR